MFGTFYLLNIKDHGKIESTFFYSFFSNPRGLVVGFAFASSASKLLPTDKEKDLIRTK